MNWIEKNAGALVLAVLVAASGGLLLMGSAEDGGELQVASTDQTSETLPESPAPSETLDAASEAPPPHTENSPHLTASSSSSSANIVSAAMPREEIEAIIRDYILENPEIIAEAFEKHMANRDRLEELSAQKALEENWDKIAFGDNAFAYGAKDAPLTVVEFFDYNCGYCRQATPTLLHIAENNDKVRVVFREFPIRGEDSSDVSRAALASIKQDKYYELHRALMTAKGSITMKRLESIAADIGIDVAKLKRDMNAKDIDRAIEENYLLADSLRIDGTPAFIVGDEIMRGWPGEDGFEDLVDEALKEAKKG